MAKNNYINLRVSDEELNKLNELSKKTNMSKSDLLRNLIMTADSNSKDKLSIEILQRIYLLTQIVLGTMKDMDEKMRLPREQIAELPIKVRKEWLDIIIENAKIKYPTD